MKFENQFFQTFEDTKKNFLTRVNPTAVSRPKIIGWSESVARDLGILRTDEKLTEILSGNYVSSEMKPYSARYGGHQFGHWAGQLGDGRAITLGEINHLEVQLKGAGLTPYSRQGDGRAVLRSSLREFICSEAMHGLGIPTTRALSLALTGDQIIRDILYNGNPAPERGAIVTRVSPSFIRFGHFEILSTNQQFDELKKLTDYVIENFYPEILVLNLNEKQKYAEFLKQVAVRTAQMITGWMSVGFVHGVMNTDNMSILGLTIDYGPYGWVEEFDSDFTPNTTDFHQRRYRYSAQPQIALWNLNCLANALFPLIEDKDLVVEALNHYQKRYESVYSDLLSKKLGIQLERTEQDSQFLTRLFDLLHATQVDYNLFFRHLSQDRIDGHFFEEIKNISYKKDFESTEQSGWYDWIEEYGARIKLQARPDYLQTMKSSNPSIIFRNYLAQQAIDAAEKDDYSLIEKYLEELKEPFKDRDLNHDPMAQKRPAWADDKPGCSILSCSS
ncbi:MAG: YdiU family protein [Moraxellaceae bacterium]|nr:YdiU family protein [Pseudobdellovibrionaceae bacterium]